MKKTVIDASVILCFLLDEKQSLSAQIETLLKKAQKGKIEILSSFLLPLEVGNGLRFSLKDPILSNEVFQRFLSLPIRYINLSKVQLQKALELSYKYSTTFYDCSYHVLAQIQNAQFLTCDNEYFEKAEELGSIELLR